MFRSAGPSKILSPKQRRAIIFGVVAAIIGVVTLTLSHAQTPSSGPGADSKASVEAVTTNDPIPQPFIASTGIDKVWERTTGNPSVIIAVIGSGADMSQPDMSDQLVSPYNVATNNTDVTDESLAGTRMAYIIAAKANNGVGSVGGCPGCKVMPIKFTVDAAGAVNAGDHGKAIRYAVDHGAKIIHYGNSYTTVRQDEQDAVTYARSKGVLFVASAGNVVGDAVRYPASMSAALSVTGLGVGSTLKDTVAYGQWIKLAAPGQDYATVSSTDKTQYSTTAFGTGQAAAAVVSVAGLLKSAFPSATDVQLYDALTKTTDPCCDSKIGGGMLNAVKAFDYLADIFGQPHIGAVVTPTPTPPTPTPPTPTPPTPTPPTPSPSGKKGDLNGDNKINLTDLSVLLSHWGKSSTAAQGDLNGDGKVTLTDLSALLSNWGK